VRHPWKPPTRRGDSCAAATAYERSVVERQAREALRLASVTGWNLGDISKKMGQGAGGPVKPAAWWEGIWK
jgi:hypothetical protein